jgi:hypothetical protein
MEANIRAWIDILKYWKLTSGSLTGQRSNQLNYVPSLFSSGLWETRIFTVLP